MKINLDNEGLEPRENVIINMLTCAELGWELGGLRQPMISVAFHLLLIRMNVEQVVESGCLGEQPSEGGGLSQSRWGQESLIEQPMVLM